MFFFTGNGLLLLYGGWRVERQAGRVSPGDATGATETAPSVLFINYC